MCMLTKCINEAYLDQGAVIFQFTWLMINVPTLCTDSQLRELAPTVELLKEIYFLDRT